jgi:hypothetical protein
VAARRSLDRCESRRKFTPQNTSVRPDGRRAFLTCKRNQNRRWHQADRERVKLWRTTPEAGAQTNPLHRQRLAADPEYRPRLNAIDGEQLGSATRPIPRSRSA